jgi:hypothetical protein
MIERNVQLSEGSEQAEQKAIQEHSHHRHRELPMQPCFHSIVCGSSACREVCFVFRFLLPLE